MKTYVLTEPIFNRLKQKLGGQPPKCHFCGEILTPEQKYLEFEWNNDFIKITLVRNPEIVSISHYGGHVKHYHKKCFEKTLH